MPTGLKLNKKDVITLKMLGGDEVIARFASQDDDTVVVTKPMLVGLTQQGFQLMPYIITAEPDQEFRLLTNSIICVSKTLEKLQSEYIRHTTGLIV